jgi:hypothetical protein
MNIAVHDINIIRISSFDTSSPFRSRIFGCQKGKPPKNPFYVPHGHLIRNTAKSQKLLSVYTQNVEEPYLFTRDACLP